MLMDIKDNGSRILRHILKIRNEVSTLYEYYSLKNSNHFQAKKFYMEVLQHMPKVEWRGLVSNNKARPRVVIVLWLACQKRLATKDILVKFGIKTDLKCVFYDCAETIHHLLFYCRYTKRIWGDILEWINISHTIQGWNQELTWLVKFCKSKNWRS
ncbi:unnamed protein product [Vicia faba]|uniref:Reverse transcriptase zinc-binding domain-containing protein n=1 Tax=Vicia faba TaxID=3906 RepID=A0AAV0YEP2_VICFA|nr:unnamed protein product [Vicia faba]